MLLILLVFPLNTRIEAKLFGPAAEEDRPQIEIPEEERIATARVGKLSLIPLALGVGIAFLLPLIPGVPPVVARLAMPIGILFGIVGQAIATAVLTKRLGLKKEPVQDEALTQLTQELASKMDVKFKGVQITTDIVGRTSLNASVSSDGLLTVTELATKELTQDEMSALIAHELAHLKLRHVQNRRAIVFGFAVVLMLPMFLLLGARAFVPPSVRLWIMAVPILTYPLALIGLKRLMRTQEYAADELAARTTGDPAALESALAKIVTCSPMPHIHDVEDMSTHPAYGKRVQALRKLV
jgi:Zn-dependent protease with chaperone function